MDGCTQGLTVCTAYGVLDRTPHRCLVKGTSLRMKSIASLLRRAGLVLKPVGGEFQSRCATVYPGKDDYLIIFLLSLHR